MGYGTANSRRNRDKPRVGRAECDRRALSALLDAGGRGLQAATIAAAIWPERKFDRRGAGFAAQPTLLRLRDRGLAKQRWDRPGITTWTASAAARVGHDPTAGEEPPAKGESLGDLKREAKLKSEAVDDGTT